MVKKALEIPNYFQYHTVPANLFTIWNQNLSQTWGLEVTEYLFKKVFTRSQNVGWFTEGGIFIAILSRDFTSFLEEQLWNWLGMVGVVRLGFPCCFVSKIFYSSGKQTRHPAQPSVILPRILQSQDIITVLGTGGTQNLQHTLSKDRLIQAHVCELFQKWRDRKEEGKKMSFLKPNI